MQVKMLWQYLPTYIKPPKITLYVTILPFLAKKVNKKDRNPNLFTEKVFSFIKKCYKIVTDEINIKKDMVIYFENNIKQ